MILSIKSENKSISLHHVAYEHVAESFCRHMRIRRLLQTKPCSPERNARQSPWTPDGPAWSTGLFRLHPGAAQRRNRHAPELWTDRRRKGAKKQPPEMRFDIGSVTNPNAAAAVLRQVRLGKIRLDFTVAECFPDAPRSTRHHHRPVVMAHQRPVTRR